MVEFHEDVLSHILSRLPVKSILRCRCVSKHWCTLTSSQPFIKKHLHNSLNNKTNQTLILYQNDAPSFYSIGLSSLTDQAQKLDLHVILSYNIIKFIGSCNGLLCFSTNENCGKFVIIWNPATRTNVKLPAVIVPFAQEIRTFTMHGFGYDYVTDDYFVMTLVQFYEVGSQKVFKSEANLYSLRSNMWRKVQILPKYFAYEYEQVRIVFACGALHWFLMEERESEDDIEFTVASFDLATGEFNVVAQPDFADLGFYFLYLLELEGCLSIVYNYFELGIVHVWVMKEYGVAGSWTKLLSVDSEFMRSKHFMSLACSQSGDEVLILINYEELYWYNIGKKTFKVVDVDFHGFPRPFSAVSCLESLVSLGDRAENDEKRRVENKRTKGKLEEKVIS